MIFFHLLLATSLVFQPIIEKTALSKEDIEDIVPRESKILLIGDSLAVGMKSHFVKSGKTEGYRVIVDAKGGTRIDQWARKMQKMMEKNSPDLVVVSLGTNDSFLKIPEAQREYTRKLIHEVADRGSKLVWILPPRLPKSAAARDSIVRIIKEEMKGNGEIFDSDGVTSHRAEDGIHFKTVGYLKWESTVWEFLKSKKIIR